MSIMIGPPRSDIYEEAREMNPVRFEKGKLIPVDIGFDLHRFERSALLSGFAASP